MARGILKSLDLGAHESGAVATEDKVTRSKYSSPPSYEESISIRDEIIDVEPFVLPPHMISLDLLDNLDLARFDEDEGRLGDIAHMLRRSGVAHDFRERLRSFVFPLLRYQITSLLDAVLPSPSEIFHLACRVNWEVLDFISEELGSGQDYASLLTITGTTMRAQGVPCQLYMRERWLDTADGMLEAFIYAAYNGESCKSRIHYDGCKVRF